MDLANQTGLIPQQFYALDVSGNKIVQANYDGLLLTNTTTSRTLGIGAGGFLADGLVNIDPLNLSAITANPTPTELVINNNLIVQDDDTAPDNIVSIQSGVIGVGTNFGIDYESSTNQDFTIQTTNSNTGGVVFKQYGIGSTTTQSKIKQGVITCNNTANTNSITIDASNNNIVITDGTTTNTIDKNGISGGATDITITDSTATAGTFYPTFVNSAGTNKSVRIDTTGLTYDASSNTLTTTNFAGTATHATDITITDTTSTAGTYYPTFVNTAGTQKSVRVDTTGLTYTPTSNSLSCAEFRPTTTNINNNAVFNETQLSLSYTLTSNNTTINSNQITCSNAINTTTIIPASITSPLFVGDLSGNATTATRATNIAGGLGGSIPYQTAVNTTALLANGTAGQVLTSAGTTLAPTWTTPAGGGSTINITDTNTNATFYPTFVSASGSGQTLRADTSSTNALKYNPSQNLLFSSDTASSTTLSLRSNYSNTGSGSADLDLVSGSGSSNMSVNLSCNDAYGDYSVLSLKSGNINLFTGIPNGESMFQTGIQLTADADIYYANDTYATDNFYISRVNANGWSWGSATEVGQYPTPPLGIGVFTSTKMTLSTAGVLTTFTPPICATAPTTANQLGNKTYIDNFGGSGGWYYTTTISPSATTTLAFPNCFSSNYNAYDVYFVSNLSSPTSGYITFQMSFTGINTPTYQSWTSSLSSVSGASPSYLNAYATTAPYINFGQDFSSYINRAYTYPLELWGTKSITGGASTGRFQYKTEGQTSANPGFTGYANQFGSVGYASGNLTGITLTASSAVSGSFTIVVKAKY
jgi:hypothetical protein